MRPQSRHSMDQAARCVVFGVPSADHLYVRAVVGPKGMVHIHGLAHLANHEVLVFRTSLAESLIFPQRQPIQGRFSSLHLVTPWHRSTALPSFAAIHPAARASWFIVHPSTVPLPNMQSRAKGDIFHDDVGQSPSFVRLDSTRLDSCRVILRLWIFPWLVCTARGRGTWRFSTPMERGGIYPIRDISLSTCMYCTSYTQWTHPCILVRMLPRLWTTADKGGFCRLTLDPRSWDMYADHQKYHSKPSSVIAGACAYLADLVLLLEGGLCLGNPRIARLLNHIKCLEPPRKSGDLEALAGANSARGVASTEKAVWSFSNNSPQWVPSTEADGWRYLTVASAL